MGSLYKNIQIMLEFLKVAFLALHFTYYTLMTFLMMFSVMLLSMLMILLFTVRTCSKNMGRIVSIFIVSYFFVIRFVSITYWKS